MLFTTWTFAVFLFLSLVLYWAMPGNRSRQFLLIGLGYAFFTYYYPAHLPLFVVLNIGVYLAGRSLCERSSLRVYGLSIGMAIAVLLYYKYIGFFAETLSSLYFADQAHWLLSLRPSVIPLGLSFFVFEYVIFLSSAYQRAIPDDNLFSGFMSFIVFYPTFISGPIKKYQTFVAQRIDAFDATVFQEGLTRLAMGFAKKGLADLTVPLSPLIMDPYVASECPVWSLWIGMYAYAWRIYLDFSGYSDMAIGAARLFGFRIEENFDYPYLKTNISSFWQSWHMTLTNWVFEYIYMPLAALLGRHLPQVSWLPFRYTVLIPSFISMFITMSILGLWHGPSWHYVVYGMYHGLLLIGYHAYARLRTSPLKGTVPKILSCVLTFHLVAFGFVLFAADFETAKTILTRLFFLAR